MKSWICEIRKKKLVGKMLKRRVFSLKKILKKHFLVENIFEILEIIIFK
jgi:hypothetical protein